MANASESKGLLTRWLYRVRDWRSREMFRALEERCRGDVLDIGGWDFFQSVRDRVAFDSWTTVDFSRVGPSKLDDKRFRPVRADGCQLPFAGGSFDTVLNIQVLEHVFEPIAMVNELARVLKPGGIAIVLVPQTSNLHMLPHHYYNFTRYWCEAAVARSGLELIRWIPLGGAWSTLASRLVYGLLQAAGATGTVYPKQKRPWLFWVLAPFMAIYAIISIPICLVFSLADMPEEPNNHLVIARKP